MKKFSSVLIVIVVLTLLLLWLVRPREVAPVTEKAMPIREPVATSKAPAEILPAKKDTEIKPPAPAPEPEVSPAELEARTELHEAVTDMISLLEANNAADYILKYMDPEGVRLGAAHFAAEGMTLEQSLKPLRGRPLLPPMLDTLQGLKGIGNATPRFNKDFTEASYPIDPALSAKLMAHPSAIYFHKIDGKWYGGK